MKQTDLRDKIELLNDKIAFRFIEDRPNSNFRTLSKTGIIVAESTEKLVGKARWGEVILIGPDVNDVKEKDYILVEPLRWTTELELEGVPDGFWMTDEKSVLAVSEDFPE